MVAPLRCQRQLPPPSVPFGVKGWERGEPSLSLSLSLLQYVSHFTSASRGEFPTGWLVGCAREKLSCKSGYKYRFISNLSRSAKGKAQGFDRSRPLLRRGEFPPCEGKPPGKIAHNSYAEPTILSEH